MKRDTQAATRVRNSKTSISWETCSTFDTLKLKIDDFLRRQSQNAAPATTFDTVTRSCSLAKRFVKTAPLARHKVLRLPRDWTIHRHKLLRLPWKNMKKRPDNIDTLLKYCTCRAKRKRYLDACRKTQEIYFAHGIDTFWAPPIGTA